MKKCTIISTVAFCIVITTSLLAGDSKRLVTGKRTTVRQSLSLTAIIYQDSLSKYTRELSQSKDVNQKMGINWKLYQYYLQKGDTMKAYFKLKEYYHIFDSLRAVKAENTLEKTKQYYASQERKLRAKSLEQDITIKQKLALKKQQEELILQSKKTRETLRSQILESQKQSRALELKANRINILQQKEVKEKQEELLTVNTRINRLILAFTVIVAIFVFFIWRRRLKAKRLSEELAVQNKKIHQLALELLEQNKLKNKLFSIISHDLRTPVSELYFLLGQLESTQEQLKSRQHSIQKLQFKINVLYITLDNLLVWSHYQLTPAPPKISRIWVSNIIENVVDSLQIVINYLSIRVSDNIEYKAISANQRLLEVIMTNLLCKAISHTNTKERVLITGKQNGNYYDIMIESIVKSQALTPKFTEFVNLRSNDLWLKICEELVAKLNGMLSIEVKSDNSITILLRLVS